VFGDSRETYKQIINVSHQQKGCVKEEKRSEEDREQSKAKKKKVSLLFFS
jgi:hypothetical protein